MAVIYSDNGKPQISGKLSQIDIAELQRTPEGRALLEELQNENPRWAGARVLADAAMPGKVGAGLGLMGVLAMAAKKAGVPLEVLEAARAAVRGGAQGGRVRSGAKAGIESTVQRAVKGGKRATKAVSPAAKAERDGFTESVTNALNSVDSPKPQLAPPNPRIAEMEAAMAASGAPKGGRKSLMELADVNSAGKPAYYMPQWASPMEQGGDIANALRAGRGAEPLVPGARPPLPIEKNAAAEGFARASGKASATPAAASPIASGGSKYRKLLGGAAGLGGLGAGLGALDYLSNQGDNSLPDAPASPNIYGKGVDNGMFPGAIESIMSNPPNMKPRQPISRPMPQRLPMPRPRLDMGGDPEELYGQTEDPLARLQDMDRENPFAAMGPVDPSMMGGSENYSEMMKKRNPLMNAIMAMGKGLGKVF